MDKTRPIRLTVVLTHPVQYYSPWFRHIAERASSLDLTVLYAAAPTPEQQGAGFGRPFTWDVPLTAGYNARFARDARAGDRFDASSFFGIDVPDIGARIAETRPDVVMIPGWHSIVFVRALAAARYRGIPVLYRGDTNLTSAPSGWRRFAWRMKSYGLLRQFSGHLSVGSRARDYLMAFGVDHRYVFKSPHAVDNDFFAATAAPHQTTEGRRAARERLGIDPSAYVALFVGKFETKKRPLDLIRAAGRLPEKPTLIFAGAGPLEEEMRHESASGAIAARFTGFVNQSQLGELYAAADTLVLPSSGAETWGLVVNEAFATGLPVVAANDVGCVPDLVDVSTGTTFQTGNTHDLTRALSEVQTAGRSHYEVACRARIARYTFASATQGLVDACRAVTVDAPRRLPAVRVIACCGHMVTVTGLERHTFQTLRALRARGAAVHCIVNSWEHHRITRLADEIDATWSVGAYYHAIRRRGLSLRKVAGMLSDVLETSAGLLRDVHRTRATVVIVPDHSATIRNAPALAWLRLRGRVRIIGLLGNPPDPGRFYSFYWRWLQQPLTTLFVANSRYTADQLAARGIDRRKVRLVYNALPPDRRLAAPPPASGRIERRVVFVGQIIPQKGVDLLLDAIAIVRGRGIDASLDIVGDIDGWTTEEYREYRRQLRLRAAQPDLAGSVSFLGWRDDVPAVLARASLHCIPSRREQYEGFGYVTLEAKEAGIPSVALPSGAAAEIVHHRIDGWLCEAFTAEALAEGIEYFLSDRDALLRAGDAARASAGTFEPAAYEALWWSCVAEEPSDATLEVASERSRT